MESIICARLTLAIWLLFIAASLLDWSQSGASARSTAAHRSVNDNSLAEEDGEEKVNNQSARWNISIRMPDIRPDHSEQYLCMARRVARADSSFIVGFKPHSSAHRVHHMLVYACQWPGIYQRDAPNFVWDCGSMHAPSETSAGGEQSESSFERGPPCQGQTQILYGWAMGAPALELPAGVGFEVGGPTSGLDFLVLQLHYGRHADFDRLPELTDNSGLELELASGEIGKRAGVLLLSSVGFVAPGRSRHEIWCPISDDIELHPFRYRTHTHGLGVRVLGAKLNSRAMLENGLPVQQAQLIGAGDPQKPQMFYQVQEPLVVRRGDEIYAYCEFENNRSHVVRIGSSGDDEMCNFYLMYWTAGPSLLSYQDCVSQNPRAELASYAQLSL